MLGEKGAEQLKGKTKVNATISHFRRCPEGEVDRRLFGIYYCR